MNIPIKHTLIINRTDRYHSHFGFTFVSKRTGVSSPEFNLPFNPNLPYPFALIQPVSSVTW